MNPNDNNDRFDLPLLSPLAEGVRAIAELPLDPAAIERVRDRAKQLTRTGASAGRGWSAQNCDAGSVAHVADAASVGGFSSGTRAQRMRPPRTAPPPRSVQAGLVRRRALALAGAGLAAGALVAVALVVTGNRDAWAQVAKSVQAKLWVHWTLKIPEEAKEEPGATEEMLQNPPEIWISLPKKIGASRFLQNMFYVDFAKQESYRYEPAEKTVYFESTSDADEAQFQHFSMMLRLVAEGDREFTLPESPIKLVQRSKLDKQEGDRRWTEFTFKFHDPRRTADSYTTTIRVDPESQLPIDMTSTEQPAGGDPPVARTYIFDYPESGPSDIYALGVPRTATLVDWRRPAGASELYAAHQKGYAQWNERYSAIVVMSDRKAAFSDIFEGFCVRYDGQSWQVETADFDQLLKIREQVWSKQITIPEDADRATWWKEQVSRVAFGPPIVVPHPLGSLWLPDRAGYYQLGDPTAHGGQCTIDKRPAIGPQNAILMTVRTTLGINNYWFDPEHDFMASRFECLSGDSTWKYRTILVDKFEKSPGGRWYAIEARCGDVQTSGDEPPDERGVAPVTTSVYRYFVEFE
jgi:hypothetical protein